MMVKSTPRQTDSFSGEMETSEGEAKEHGRRLPNVERDLRRVRRPCSGRTAPVPHSCGWVGVLGIGLVVDCLVGR